MSNESGGNPRFKGPGMQWKTPWKKHAELLPQMPFIEGWRVGEGVFALYYTATTPLVDDGAGFWRAAVLFIRPGAAVSDQEAVACTQAPDQPAAAKGGWRFFVDTDGSLNFEVGDTVGVFPAAKSAVGDAAFYASSPDQVTPALAVPILGVFRGNGTSIDLYVNGLPVTPASFAALLYQDPTIGQVGAAFGLGDDFRTSGSPAENLGINGCVGGPGIPSAPQIAQWFADVKTQLTTPVIAGMTSNQWTANPYIAPNAWQVYGPDPIADEVDAAPISRFATLPTFFTIRNYQVLFSY